jgi:hypothetical protein
VHLNLCIIIYYTYTAEDLEDLDQERELLEQLQQLHKKLAKVRRTPDSSLGAPILRCTRVGYGDRNSDLAQGLGWPRVLRTRLQLSYRSPFPSPLGPV